ncbi:hypothetical protein [Nocardioides maradonensis]
MIRTPFGDAVIQVVDSQGLLVKTDLGVWDYAEIEFRGSLEDGESVVDFLSGPRFEVLTSTDYEVNPCTCGCRDCSDTRQRHKLTGRTTIRGHERRANCRCEVTGCHCVAVILEP